MPTEKPPDDPDALTFAPDVAEALASFQVDFGRGTVPPPGKPGKYAKRPVNVSARPQREPGLVHRLSIQVDHACAAWDELEDILRDHPAKLPDAIDAAAIERVRADLSALRSQIAGWQFAHRSPASTYPSRVYRAALRAKAV